MAEKFNTSILIDGTVTISPLPAGRVVYTGAGGELKTDAGFEYNDTTDTLKVTNYEVTSLTWPTLSMVNDGAGRMTFNDKFDGIGNRLEQVYERSTSSMTPTGAERVTVRIVEDFVEGDSAGNSSHNGLFQIWLSDQDDEYLALDARTVSGVPVVSIAGLSATTADPGTVSTALATTEFAMVADDIRDPEDFVFGLVPGTYEDAYTNWQKIQARIDAAAALGDTVRREIRLPAGLYWVTKPLWIWKSNIVLVGAGQRATTISSLMGSGHVIVLGPPNLMPLQAVTGTNGFQSLATGTGAAVRSGAGHYHINLWQSYLARLLGTGTAFTVRMFWRFNALSDTYCWFIGSDYGVEARRSLALLILSDGRLLLVNYNVTTGLEESTYTPGMVCGTDTAYDIETSWDGTNFRVFVGGVIAITHAYSGPNPIRPGVDVLSVAMNTAHGGAGLNTNAGPEGWFDNLQLLDIAFHTSNFTAPTAKRAVDSHTLFVTNFEIDPDVPHAFLGYQKDSLAAYINPVGMGSDANQFADSGVKDLSIIASNGASSILNMWCIKAVVENINCTADWNGIAFLQATFASHGTNIHSTAGGINFMQLSQSMQCCFTNVQVFGGIIQVILQGAAGGKYTNFNISPTEATWAYAYLNAGGEVEWHGQNDDEGQGTGVKHGVICRGETNLKVDGGQWVTFAIPHMFECVGGGSVQLNEPSVVLGLSGSQQLVKYYDAPLVRGKAEGVKWFGTQYPISLSPQYIRFEQGGISHDRNLRLTPRPITLTDASTVTIDAALGNVFTLTAAGNRTILASNGTHGQPLTVIHVQDATGGRVPVFKQAPGSFRFPADTPPTVTVTTPGTVDYYQFVYNGADNYFDYQPSSSFGFAGRPGALAAEASFLYRFEEAANATRLPTIGTQSATDHSSNIGQVAGIIGNAANFGTTNTNKYFSIPSHTENRPVPGVGGANTWWIWFKPVDRVGNQVLFAAYDGGSNNQFFFLQEDTTGNLYYTVNGSGAASSLVPTIGSWNLIIVKSVGTTHTVRLNNGTAQTIVTGSSHIAGTAPITIGDIPSVGWRMKGAVDLFGFIKRATTPYEESKLWNGGAGFDPTA
jgi:hypothetical protein